MPAPLLNFAATKNFRLGAAIGFRFISNFLSMSLTLLFPKYSFEIFQMFPPLWTSGEIALFDVSHTHSFIGTGARVRT